MTPIATEKSTDRENSQLTLHLKEPVAQAYRPSNPPPKEHINFSLFLARICVFGALGCVGLLAYLVVITNPTTNTNVLAVLTTIFFGVFFSSWSFEHWALSADETAQKQQLSTWSVTRHALLVAVSVSTLAGAALNGSASFGLIVLLIFTAAIGNHVLRRVRVR